MACFFHIRDIRRISKGLPLALKPTVIFRMGMRRSRVQAVYRPSVYTVGLHVDCVQLSSYNLDTTPTRHSPNAVEPTLEKCTMFERKSSCPANTTHLYDMYTMSAQRLRLLPNIA